MLPEAYPGEEFSEEPWQDIDLHDPNRPVIITIPYNVVTGLNPQRPEFREEAIECYEMALLELQFQGSVYSVFSTYTLENLTTPPSWNTMPSGSDPRYVFTYDIQRVLGGRPGERYLEVTVWAFGDDKVPFVYMSTSSDSYVERREVFDEIPTLIWKVTSTLPSNTNNIPMPDEEDYAWKHKWLYFGFMAGGSARFFTAHDDRTGWRKKPLIGGSFDVGVKLEFQFLSKHWTGNYFSLSVLTGANLDTDNVNFTGVSMGEHVAAVGATPGYVNWSMVDIPLRATSLSIPVGLKVNLKPKNIALGLYGQVYAIVPLETENTLATLGWKTGLEVGMHLGPGVIFLDTAFVSDIDTSTFSYNGGADQQYKRMWLSFSMGYSIGIKTKPIPRYDVPIMTMKHLYQF
jgi:hypothetical protein